MRFNEAERESMKLDEAFSNWSYYPPKDPEKKLYDFYFLTTMLGGTSTHDIRANFSIDEAVQIAVNSLQKHMVKVLREAIIDEIAVWFDTSLAERVSKLGNEALAKKMLVYFKKSKIDWAPLWFEITKTFQKLLEVDDFKDKAVWIDHAYDLQHVSGSVFLRVKSYAKRGSRQWLETALEFKKGTRDVRDYYNKVSTQLKPVVAYIAKNVHGTAMDSPKTVA